MVHEIKITLYNPTDNHTTWTADVYLKSIESPSHDPRDERIYCGTATVVENRVSRGQTKAEALAEALKFLEGWSLALVD